jgi:RNA polymerase-binding transcription factor DksA
VDPTDALDPSNDHLEPSNDEAGDSPDLGHVMQQLDAVETALERLDAGTYWTDEVTGDPIPEHVLDADPVTRRVPS